MRAPPSPELYHRHASALRASRGWRVRVDSLTFSLCRQDDREATYEFHRRTSGEYIWPRTDDEFRALIDEQQVFVAKTAAGVAGLVAGLCYAKRDDDADRWEFGGVCVDNTLRGRGVAAVLGRIAISTAFLMDDPPGELIAHVHEFNHSPRHLLVTELGFLQTGEQEIPPIEPPPSMKRNDRGQVVGDLFRFQVATLAAFADWFEQFNGTILGKQGATPAHLDVLLWRERSRLLPALREIAASAIEIEHLEPPRSAPSS